jgi:hypothetical protein
MKNFLISRATTAIPWRAPNLGRPRRSGAAIQGMKGSQSMKRNLKALCLGLFAAFALSAFAANSAMGAAADFKAGALNTVIHAVQDPDEPVQRFVTPIGTLTCEEVSGTATLAAQSPELTGKEIKYSKCHATALKIPVTVDVNGCHYKFTAGTANAGGSVGSVHIENCLEGKGITITIFDSATIHTEPHNICTMHVAEQTVSPVNYFNRTTAGKNEEVTIEAKAAKVKTTTTHSENGSICTGATHEFEAEYTGRITASGTVNGVGTNATVVST